MSDLPPHPGVHVRCRACGAVADGEALEARERMFGLPGEFRYRACTGCGSLSLVDPPADLSPYYPPGYYARDVDPVRVLAGWRGFLAGQMVRGARSSRGRRLAAAAWTPRRQVRSLATALRSMRRSGRLSADARTLDVGCGQGVMVYALAVGGLPRPRGVDAFATPRRFANGARVDGLGVDELDGEFDLITFHHSLEHLPDPASALDAARRRLAPGGRIVVRAPTVSSVAFTRYRECWVALDAPRHLMAPSREGMRRLSARAGLCVEDVRDDATAMQFWASEQNRHGIPLSDPRSRLMDPWRPRRHWVRLPWWWWRTRRLNAEGRGDQAAWVLRPVAGDGDAA